MPTVWLGALALLVPSALSAHLSSAVGARYVAALEELVYGDPQPEGKGKSDALLDHEVRERRMKVKERGDMLWTTSTEHVWPSFAKAKLSDSFTSTVGFKSKSRQKMFIQEVKKTSKFVCHQGNISRPAMCHFEPNNACALSRRVHMQAKDKHEQPPVAKCVEDHSYRDKNPFIVLEVGAENIGDWMARWLNSGANMTSMWALLQRVFTGIDDLQEGYSVGLHSGSFVIDKDDGPVFTDLGGESWPPTCEESYMHLTESFNLMLPAWNDQKVHRGLDFKEQLLFVAKDKLHAAELFEWWAFMRHHVIIPYGGSDEDKWIHGCATTRQILMAKTGHWLRGWEDMHRVLREFEVIYDGLEATGKLDSFGPSIYMYSGEYERK